MSGPDTPSLGEQDDLSFVKTLYDASVKDLLEMDQTRLGTFLAKTEVVCRWLKGVRQLANHLNQKGV